MDINEASITHRASNDNLLVNHAINHIWANPVIDKQAIFAAVRMTVNSGVMHYARFYRFAVNLPTINEYYHLYQLGYIPTDTLGILSNIGTWECVGDVMNESCLLIQLYTDDGKLIPRFNCYMMRRPDGNILFAVKLDRKLPDLSKRQLYIRFYTNALSESVTDPETFMISQAFGRKVTNQRDISWLYDKWANLITRKGTAIVNVNCNTRTEFDLQSVKIGDLVEFEQDISVFKVSEFLISDLKPFSSLKDDCRKYLLHPTTSQDTISFFDDVDCYLMSKDKDNRQVGVYYHRNDPKAMRQVSHNDYSIPVMFVQGLVDDNTNLLSADGLKLRCYVRDGGFSRRELIPVHNRCRELYKFDNTKIVEYMVGTNTDLPEWRAENLEVCEYMDVVSAPIDTINAREVALAYGYNGLVKAFAEVLVDCVDGKVEVPYVYQDNSYYFEIRNGEFGEAKNIIANTPTLEWNKGHEPQAAYFIYGSRNPRDVVHQYDQGVIPLPPDDWSLFGRTITGGFNGAWENVTRSPDHVLIEDGLIKLQQDQRRWEYYFRRSNFTIERKVTVNIAIGEQAVVDLQDVVVPYRHILVLGNNKRLTRGVDWDVADGKLVYFGWGHANNTPFELKVYLHGMPLPVGVTMPGKEFGFIQHGLVSYNDQYILKDDYSFTLSVDNLIVKPSDYVFAEDSRGVHVPNHSDDGEMYAVDRILPPLGTLNIGINETELMERSLNLDNRLSTMLTRVKPDTVYNDIVAVAPRKRTSSPFLTVIYNNLDKILPWGESYVTDVDLDKRVSVYDWILKCDPASKPVDDAFLVVRPYQWDLPNAIGVSISHFDVLQRVVNRYLGGQIEIKQYFSIED